MTLAIDSNTLRYIYERLVGRRCGITYTPDNRIAITKLSIGHTTNRDALNGREKTFYDCFEGFGLVTREELALAFNNVMNYIDTLVATGKMPHIENLEKPESCPVISTLNAGAPAPAPAAPVVVPTHSEYTLFASGVNIGGGATGAPVAAMTFFAPGARLSPGETLVSVMISTDVGAASQYSVEITERTTGERRTVYSYTPDPSKPNGDTISRDVPLDYTVGEQPALFVILVAPAPLNADGHPIEMAMQLVVRRRLPTPLAISE